jgi:DNA polymerase III alpha subunit (gram-positive type)
MASSAQNQHQLVFYDFETTGLNPFHEEIIEYAFYNYHTGEKITGIVNPEKTIPSIVCSITKITNDMVRCEEPLEGHANILHSFLNRPNLIFVAHNGDGFDKFFLKRMVDRL